MTYGMVRDFDLLLARFDRFKKGAEQALGLIDSFLADTSVDGDDGAVIEAYEVLVNLLKNDEEYQKEEV